MVEDVFEKVSEIGIELGLISEELLCKDDVEVVLESIDPEVLRKSFLGIFKEFSY